MRLNSRALLALLLGLGVMICGSPAPASEADDATQSDAVVASATTAKSATETAWDLLHSLTPAFDVTFASKYMFQGLDLSDGASVAQPNLAVSRKGWTGTVWANYQPNLGDVNRVELSLKYTHTVEQFSFSPGYKYVRSPNTHGIAPTQEIFVDAALRAELNPCVSFHRDVDQGDGNYVSLGLSHTLTVPLTLGANAFYLNDYYGLNGWTAVELRASSAIPWDNFIITPSISRFVTPENGDFRDEAYIPGSWFFTVKIAPKL